MSGRWPANVILDDGAAAMLDAQSGERKSGGGDKGNRPGSRGWFGLDGGGGFSAPYEADTGGASRFMSRANSRAELVEWLVRLITPPGGTVLLIGVDGLTEGLAEPDSIGKAT